MKKLQTLLVILCCSVVLMAQDYDPNRIRAIETNLTALEIDIPGLTEKIDVSLQQSTLSTFLLAISEVHRINIDVHPELAATEIVNNFKDVAVGDVLSYLCKNQNLQIDITGTILSISRFDPEPEEEAKRIIPIKYNPVTKTLFADLQQDSLSTVFKEISEKSGKGIFFAQGMGGTTISAYINDIPFETAMEKIAFSNNLLVTKTKDGLYEFEKMETQNTTAGANTTIAAQRPRRSRKSNFYFKILDTINKRLDISFENVPVSDIIYDIGDALNIDIFTASPLDDAGIATVSAKNVSFDKLLTKIFESETAGAPSRDLARARSQAGGGQNPATGGTQRFTFKVDNGVYYFGTENQLSLRSSEIVPLMYRSIEMLADPQNAGRTVGRTANFGQSFGGSFDQNQNGFQGNNNSRNGNGFRNETQSSTAGQFVDLIPDDVKGSLSITADIELNSLIVSGASEELIKLKEWNGA